MPVSTNASASAVRTRELSYRSASSDVVLAGYHASPEGDQLRPGVLVVHEWWGLNDYAKRRARELAALGYSALAIDMYGEGRQAADHEQAGRLMQAALADPALLRERFLAGLEQLRLQPGTDGDRLAAIGYCFGGRVVLDMARQGVDLAGVVSFHGLLATTTPATPGAVRARILVAHGDADSLVDAEEVARFQTEMREAGADYRIRHHPDAPHGFTNRASPGYREEADRTSWTDMQCFLAELFGAC
jgi:dienelactone hydrolase